MVYKSKSNTMPTSPHIARCKVRADSVFSPECKSGGRKDMIPAVNNRVMSTAEAQSHHSRCSMRRRRSLVFPGPFRRESATLGSEIVTVLVLSAIFHRGETGFEAFDFMERRMVLHLKIPLFILTRAKPFQSTPASTGDEIPPETLGKIGPSVYRIPILVAKPSRPSPMVTKVSVAIACRPNDTGQAI